jgi:hypothetical protein
MAGADTRREPQAMREKLASLFLAGPCFLDCVCKKTGGGFASLLGRILEITAEQVGYLLDGYAVRATKSAHLF